MPRSRRPPTSQSSRPSTAPDDYAFSTPGTASSSSSPYFTTENPQPLPLAIHAQYDEQTLDGVIEEDEDDESDAEGVFAYLPPSTAEQERERAQRAAPPAESPPGTSSSFNAVPGGHPMQAVSTTQNDASPPYSQPAPHFQLSTIKVKEHRVNLPAPVLPTVAPGPLQPTNTPSTSSMLPGSAFDNPYQFTLSQMNSIHTINPSTAGSTLGGADGFRHRHNINVGVMKRSRRRRGKDSVVGPDDESKDQDTTVDGLSISKFADSQKTAYQNSVAPRSSRVEDEFEEGWTPSREGSIKMEYDFDALEEEDSPYAEVRASVSNIDDPEMPALTLRMWIIGLFLCIIGSAMNVFFNFRDPAPTVIPILLLLVSYPMGKFASYTLPINTYRIRLPARLGNSIEINLNPGPWNIKEHVLVYIMSNVSISAPFTINAIVAGEIYYHIRLGYWFNLTMVLATQLSGFGLAGICRRFLVYPASMVWPQNLVTCTLLNTLHAEDDDATGGMTRYRYFMCVVAGAFAFFFLPGFLFKALSIFSWICWIAPKNVVVNQLFGVRSGLGMGILTFDWTQISWVGSPLMTPWWAEVHVFFGFVLFFWIILPILYYTNTWQLSYFPIAHSFPYDRFGNIYDVARILTSDNQLNLTAYEEYSPLFLPGTYAMTYVLALMLVTCVIVHTLLYHGRSLLLGIRRLKVEPDDIHAKLMAHYPEVPDWWYLLIIISFFCIGIVAIERWHTNVPAWALFLALILPVVYVLPAGFIFAMTGQPVPLNLPAQILSGILVPGKPLANMVFKSYSVQTLIEAISFTQDLKLGHYVKVPPRATYLVQLVATILAAFVQVSVKEWMFAHIHNMCTPEQESFLTCPHNQVIYTASAIWGLIGPQRQFGKFSIYHPQLFALIVGAVLPVPFWLWQRRFPSTRLKYINIPVLLNGVQAIPPATGINYSAWFMVAFVFQYLIRRRNFAWWTKFNYVTSAALDCGTTISLIFVFFALQFPRGGGVSLNWWGNNVYKKTADYSFTPLRRVPPGGIRIH